MESVLLIAPRFMGLQDDIITGLRDLGYRVDYLPEKTYKYDPFNLLAKRIYNKPVKKFLVELESYWTKTLSDEKFGKAYDFLLVIDGQAIHPVLFELLKKRNPDIKFVNFLFDRVDGVYAYNNNFEYFDKVCSFDSLDVEKYGLEQFQIYWKLGENNQGKKYDVFGFGTYSKFRFDIFKQLAEIFDGKFERVFLKLYNPIIKFEIFYKFKESIKRLLKLKTYITVEEYHSDLVVSKTIPPKLFRDIIASSDTVVDTSAPTKAV